MGEKHIQLNSQYKFLAALNLQSDSFVHFSSNEPSSARDPTSAEEDLPSPPRGSHSASLIDHRHTSPTQCQSHRGQLIRICPVNKYSHPSFKQVQGRLTIMPTQVDTRVLRQRIWDAVATILHKPQILVLRMGIWVMVTRLAKTTGTLIPGSPCLLYYSCFVTSLPP